MPGWPPCFVNSGPGYTSCMGPLSSLILYGLYSSGTTHQGSHLDVAAVLDGFEPTWPEIERTGPLAARLSEKFGMTVSLIPAQKTDWDSGRTLLTRNLRREGRRLH
jgi:hypothetical protein